MLHLKHMKLGNFEKRTNQNEQRKNVMEKMRKRVSPFVKWAMFFLILDGGVKMLKEFNKKLEKSAQAEYIKEIKEKRIKEKKFDGGYHRNEDGIPVGKYRYYHESLFQEYDSFKHIVENDPTFMDNITQEFFFGVKREEMTKILSKMAEDSELREGVLFLSSLEKNKILPKALQILEAKKYNAEEAEPIILELFIAHKFTQIQKQVEMFHRAKEERMSILTSPSYLERLTLELEGDREKAKQLQQKRIEKLKESSAYISNFPFHTSDNSSGFSDMFGDIVLGNEVDYYTSIHEIAHHVTENGKNTPEATSEKLKKYSSFQNKMTEEEKIHERNFYEKNKKSYYFDANEILARKVCFDMELEKFGIKKYEEKFTKEHYKKVKELQKEGVLEKNSDQFFRMFERDSLIMIMNTTAFQEYQEKGGTLDEEKLLNELAIHALNSKGDDYYPPEFWVNSKSEVS